MRFVVKHLDGRFEEAQMAGENFALGLAAVKHTCLCGIAEFIDGGLDAPPSDREPDRECSCGRKYWYYEDADEQTGFLHQS